MEFDIDFSTGEITGFNVVGVGEGYCRSILADFAAHPDAPASFPWQQDYDAPDPLRNPKSLAWQLMAIGWTLEGELAKYSAPEPDPLPDGALS